MHNWTVKPNFSQASEATADFIAEKIKLTLKHNNTCHIALPGGNTPAESLALLAKKNLPWQQLHFYLGDERCYPEFHEDRNDVMLEKNLLGKIPPTNFYRIPAELGPEQAAQAYAKIITSFSHLDIAFLGMGEDGHTASLFPGNAALKNMHPVVPVYNAPKAPAERVSLSLDTLRCANYRVVLSTGESKAPILSKIQQGKKLPINCIGDLNWFVDEAAYPLCSDESAA